MTEVWLQSNRRVLAMALIPAALLGVLGALLLATVHAAALRLLAWGLIGLGALLALGLLGQFRRPRIAYRGGEVLFNLRAGAPIAVPAEVVEAFFLGQGPAHLPRTHGVDAKTVNLVARLSQKAPEWMQMPVKPALGQWCEGYVTIRGTWCEPLTGELIRRLNSRLRELRTAATEDDANEGDAQRGRHMTRPTPRLLVSVHNATEAREALLGGADWIDLKDPQRSAVGRGRGSSCARRGRLERRPVAHLRRRGRTDRLARREHRAIARRGRRLPPQTRARRM